MSLRGQWIASYTANNTTGTLMIDIDEFDGHFEGTGVAWDNNLSIPNSLVRFRTQTKSNTQRLADVPVIPLDNFGKGLSDDVIKQLATKGIVMPITADIDLQFAGDALSIKWATPIGTSGGAVTTAPKSRAGVPSSLKPTRTRSWEGFKKLVNSLERKRYIFRGQEYNQWRLRTSFHRTGRSNLERYGLEDVPELNRTISAVTNRVYNLKDANEHAALLYLAQHHGYPTPILDWTWSPYVAAFFAFRNIEKNETTRRRHVRIFKLDAIEWNTLPHMNDLLWSLPNVTILNPLAFGNPRAIPQQSISTASNIDDIESHIENVEHIQSKKYLEVIDFPVRQRDYIMKEPALMGITAGALFPGLDGACESLKERHF